MINNIASSDPTLAQAALIEMGDLLENKEKSILVKDFEVQYIDSILVQYKVWIYHLYIIFITFLLISSFFPAFI